MPDLRRGGEQRRAARAPWVEQPVSSPILHNPPRACDGFPVVGEKRPRAGPDCGPSPAPPAARHGSCAGGGRVAEEGYHDGPGDTAGGRDRVARAADRLRRAGDRPRLGAGRRGPARPAGRGRGLRRPARGARPRRDADDTASAYHRSEERIGRCLAGDRARVTLATKCGEHNAEPDTYYDFSYPAIRKSIARSRALLQTDVIDILQIHFGPDPEAVLDDGGCVRAMREAQAAGQVRFLGASVDGPTLDRCIASGDFAVAQVGFSLLRQGEAARIARAQARGVGVFVRSGLAGGWLTPRALTVPEAARPPAVRALLALCGGDARLLQTLALHFLARHEAVSAILVGTRSAANLREAITMLHTPVDAGLLDEAIRVAQAHPGVLAPARGSAPAPARPGAPRAGAAAGRAAG